MHDSDGIIMSVAPPQMETIGVGVSFNIFSNSPYSVSIRESNLAGGSVCGVDMVMMVEILFDGSREVATMPPIECPMIMIFVSAGYRERIYSIAFDV